MYIRPVSPQELKSIGISKPSTFRNMIKWGWVDGAGRPLAWYAHQRPGHDDRLFDEPRERKPRQGRQQTR